MSGSNVEKSSYSGFERFLFFLTPVLFTAVLLGVLMLLFNSNWRHSALEIGNKIPLLSSVIPDPAEPSQAAGNGGQQLTVDNARQKVDELNAQLLEKQTALQQEQGKTAEQQKTIDDLKNQISSLNKQIEDKTITAQQYDDKIKSLASMYGKMTPSKAAPIFEKMTVEEAALVLGAMSDTERGRILEKMTPTVAADVTTRLKDADTVQNQEIAALQARIKQLEDQLGNGASTLDMTQLKMTFTSMQPAKAATLLLQMASSDQAKTIKILEALDDSSRSQVLAAMSDEDKKATGKLLDKLIPANP
ncbi:MgtE protein [Cohnella zeiphila]|uniref:MgtE protein n=1 Tax=Cohnella zeiphila TaxID=2761120 RepID=A0A7X0SMS5_9BACL|nr:MgtE protein [Cohnella zeiphila]MBB6732852.1 MgtE protein [Cohnella zeiphila]